MKVGTKLQLNSRQNGLFNRAETILSTLFKKIEKKKDIKLLLNHS